MEDMTKRKEMDARHAGYAEAAGKDTKDAEEAALNTTLRKLVCALLSCGEQDLEVLARVKYDWTDVFTRITWEDTVQELLRFEDLMWAVVDFGITHIHGALEERILGLSSRWQEDAPEGQHGLNAEEHKELFGLSLLDPQRDIFSRYDYQTQNVSVWFNKSEVCTAGIFPELWKRLRKIPGSRSRIGGEKRPEKLFLA